jgi:hypothetical protein
MKQKQEYTKRSTGASKIVLTYAEPTNGGTAWVSPILERN